MGGAGASTGGSDVPGGPSEELDHERGDEVPGVTEMFGRVRVAA